MGVLSCIHAVQVAYIVYFVEDYLVYSEMFIPKITVGIFQESDRGSHTCPLDQTQTILTLLDSVPGKFDAQTKTPFLNKSAHQRGKKVPTLGTCLAINHKEAKASQSGGRSSQIIQFRFEYRTSLPPLLSRKRPPRKPDDKLS